MCASCIWCGPHDPGSTATARRSLIRPLDPLRRSSSCRGLRVVGDIHGDLTGFAAAIAGARELDLHLLLLGDLLDGGAAPAGCARLVLELTAAGVATTLLGNHERKLLMALQGRKVRPDHGLERTLHELRHAPDASSLLGGLVQLLEAAAIWIRFGSYLFVHAAFHPAMLTQAPRTGHDCFRPDPVVSRALFGEIEGKVSPSSRPIRSQGWVDQVPAGLTVIVGHDPVSTDGRPVARRGSGGGVVWFLDTGAGKGGHLSWIDLAVTPDRTDLHRASP